MYLFYLLVNSSDAMESITKNLTATDLKIVGKDVYVNSSIINKNAGFLLIHGDFCHHCKTFIPTYQKLNQKLNDTTINFPLLAIESKEINDKLMNVLNFAGYPTIKVFNKSGLIIGDYNEKRDYETLKKNVCKIYHYCT